MIEIVYVQKNGEIFRTILDSHTPLNVTEALERSGVLIAHPEVIDFSVGVFGNQVTRDTLLTAGDRLEIYRPLTIDPKSRRRQRAKG